MLIISGYRFKKDLIKAIKEGADPYFDDPSIFNPVSGRMSEILKVKPDIVATNHPRRSWYVMITMKDGKVRVE